MAEAMLQNDEYKTSHTSLNDLDKNENDRSETKGDQQGNTPGNTKTANKNDIKEAKKHNTNGEKRSEGRTVVIQEPPKRRKVSAPFTPKEIVDGKFLWSPIVV
jgi:hypothetical protein